MDKEAQDEVCIEVREPQLLPALVLLCSISQATSPLMCKQVVEMLLVDEGQMQGVHFWPSPCAYPCACLPPLMLQVDYRWSGDANIFLAIELPAGGSATRMVPKVSNLAVRWGKKRGAAWGRHGGMGGSWWAAQCNCT